jgi:hypothetical protein
VSIRPGSSSPSRFGWQTDHLDYPFYVVGVCGVLLLVSQFWERLIPTWSVTLA